MCQERSLYDRNIAVPAQINYTPSDATARPYISSSIPYYARMPQTMGDGRHTVWSVCALWLCQERSLYDRNGAVPAQINYTPSDPTARPYISSSIPCYPRLLRTMGDGRHTVWLIFALWLCQESELYQPKLITRRMMLHHDHTYLARYYAMHGCPGLWAMADTLCD